MTKLTQIVAGNFAEGGKKNFSAYNAKGERIFIHRKTMEAQGWKKDADLAGKYPFFVVAGEREFQVMDQDNNPIEGKTFKRLQALSVFPTKEALISSYNADAELEVLAKGQLTATAKSQNLTDKAIEALLENSI